MIFGALKTVIRSVRAVACYLLMCELMAPPMGAQTLSCPLTAQALVRAPDACATEGGYFNSKRMKGKVPGLHDALDLDAKLGDDVLAIEDGDVLVADGDWGAMGGTVIIDHGNGDYSVYGHMSKVAATKGKHIKVGTKIGEVGYTGNAKCLETHSLPPHLHFAVFRTGQSGLGEDSPPLKEFKKWGVMWKTDFGADLTGPIHPGWILKPGKMACWKGEPGTDKP